MAIDARHTLKRKVPVEYETDNEINAYPSSIVTFIDVLRKQPGGSSAG